MTARRADGFTLLEVLIALAISAIALGILGALVESGLGIVGHAEEYIEATQRAQSRLEQVGAAIPLVPGEQSGDDGGGFSWDVTIAAPTTEAAPAAPAPAGLLARPALYDVTVRIGWGKGTGARNVVLRTQRVGPVVVAGHG